MSSDRNKPCRCGSGKKYKKCCGKCAPKGPSVFKVKPRKNSWMLPFDTQVSMMRQMNSIMPLAAAAHAMALKQGTEVKEEIEVKKEGQSSPE